MLSQISTVSERALKAASRPVFSSALPSSDSPKRFLNAALALTHGEIPVNSRRLQGSNSCALLINSSGDFVNTQVQLFPISVRYRTKVLDFPCFWRLSTSIRTLGEIHTLVHEFDSLEVSFHE